MFIRREIEKSIRAGALQVPVIAIIGPRQSGKSTLAREMFKDHIYLDIQDAELFDFANNDPKGFLNTYKNEYGLIIDEAQYAAPLFAQIKVEADKDPRPGYYVLSGSQNFLLLEKISESLAGRVYFYTLLPLSIRELHAAHLLAQDAADQIITGFYPRVYQPRIDSREYYENYLSTYVERDIRTVRNIESISTFKKFMRMCALRVGTTLNIAQIAGSCGIAEKTARVWLSLLEASFILFLLPPYHANLGKRVTKSPKLFFYDVGLAAALVGIGKAELMRERTMYGALFENMMIVELMKRFNAETVHPTFTFFRDSNQQKIDLIIEIGGMVVPVEIKASQTMQSSFFETLHWFQQQRDQALQLQPLAEQALLSKRNRTKAGAGWVLYGGDKSQSRSAGNALSWRDTDILVQEIIAHNKPVPREIGK